ncbi:MAG: yqfD [Clostridia bacterium]|jgi:similar to stage IV sporulation protein|nr:yqfD [Clostridia bacterium]
MIIIRLWNFLRGYAIIIVEGLKIERFINMAISNGIYIWDIKKLSYTSISAKIGLENFGKMREIVRKTDSTIVIKEKRGFPFILKDLKRHKLFAATVMILLIMIYVMCSYVWMIEVVGTKTIDPKVVMDIVNQEGLKEGVRKAKLDRHSLENKILIKLPQLSWVGIQVRGTKAVVEVVEKREEPELISKTDACDIVAAKSGVIHKILVLNGDGIVKDGVTVKKGQVLVTGTILRENSEPRLVHSLAQVTGRTWYEDAEQMDLQQIEFKDTGRKTTQYMLKLLDKEVGFKKTIPYSEYNEVREEKNIISFGNYVFPIKLISIRYNELVIVPKTLTVEQAKKRCEERLNERLKLHLSENAVVLDKKINYVEEKKSVMAKISVEILEEIGVKKRIQAK